MESNSDGLPSYLSCYTSRCDRCSPFKFFHGRKMCTRLNVLKPSPSGHEPKHLQKRVMKSRFDHKHRVRHSSFQKGDKVHLKSKHVPKPHPKFTHSVEVRKKVGPYTQGPMMMDRSGMHRVSHPCRLMHLIMDWPPPMLKTWFISCFIVWKCSVFWYLSTGEMPKMWARLAKCLLVWQKLTLHLVKSTIIGPL